MIFSEYIGTVLKVLPSVPIYSEDSMGFAFTDPRSTLWKHAYESNIPTSLGARGVTLSLL
jgi:hypothetical protein